MADESRHRRPEHQKDYLKAIKLLLEPQIIETPVPQYPLNLLEKRTEYCDKNLIAADVENFKKVLQIYGCKMTMYDRLVTKIDNLVGMKGPGRVGIIKYIGGISKNTGWEEGGEGLEDVFFFVFKHYDQRLIERRSLMETVYTTLKPRLDEFRVKDINDVIVGGLLGLYLDQAEDSKKETEYFPGTRESGNFIRIRILSIKKSTGVFNFWAVDEGFRGACNFFFEKHLYCLNDLSVGLDMLVIPGVYGKEPPLAQLERFRSAKFCFACVVEPKLTMDYGVRKIYL